MQAAIASEVERRGPWLVVRTLPHKEQFAIDNLERQDFESYCPMIRKSVRHARRMREVLRPLFPSYVFVRSLRMDQSCRPLHSTFGIRRVVAQGGKPSLLSPEFVDGLKAREIAGAIILPEVTYKKGQKVRMLGGAFDGTIATILELDDKGRITVLMDLLNQSVRVHTIGPGVRAL